MNAPKNAFKAAIKSGKTQLGCWTTLANEISAELLSHIGFDWVCIDSEHSPNGLTEIRRQLLAMRAGGTSAMVRVPVGEHWVIKQVLDIGAETIIVPLVESAEQAREIVSAIKYPPMGSRGVGAMGARASGFGVFEDYVATANDETCVLIQVETQKGMDALDEILKVDGLDGVFIGPSDLSADMGLRGQTEHPDVQAAIHTALRKIKASDKASGILTFNQTVLGPQLEIGVDFLACCMDAIMLRKTAADTLAEFRSFTGK